MNAKRLSFLLLAALALAASPLHAATATVNGIMWTYTVSDGGATVDGGTESPPFRVCRSPCQSGERRDL